MHSFVPFIREWFGQEKDRRAREKQQAKEAAEARRQAQQTRPRAGNLHMPRLRRALQRACQANVAMV